MLSIKTNYNKIRKDRYIQTVEQRRVYLEKESKIRQEQYDLEKEIERLKREKLKIALLAKDKELVNNTIQVAKNNKTLSTIVHKLNDFNVESLDESTKRQYTKLQKSIAKELETDNNWKELEKLVLTDHLDKSGTTKETKEEDSRRKEKLPRKTDLLKYLNVLSLFLFSTLFGTICVIKLSVFSLFT